MTKVIVWFKYDLEINTEHIKPFESARSILKILDL